MDRGAKHPGPIRAPGAFYNCVEMGDRFLRLAGSLVGQAEEAGGQNGAGLGSEGFGEVLLGVPVFGAGYSLERPANDGSGGAPAFSELGPEIR